MRPHSVAGYVRRRGRPVRWSGYLAGANVVDRHMTKGGGRRGGQGSRTFPVTIEEPVLVPMSDAERVATVSILTEILAGWWTTNSSHDRIGP